MASMPAFPGNLLYRTVPGTTYCGRVRQADTQLNQFHRFMAASRKKLNAACPRSHIYPLGITTTTYSPSTRLKIASTLPNWRV
jgi:hypothetical protein